MSAANSWMSSQNKLPSVARTAGKLQGSRHVCREMRAAEAARQPAKKSTVTSDQDKPIRPVKPSSDVDAGPPMLSMQHVVLTWMPPVGVRSLAWPSLMAWRTTTTRSLDILFRVKASFPARGRWQGTCRRIPWSCRLS